MRSPILILALTIALVLAVGCSSRRVELDSPSAGLARDFLSNKGYEIVSYEGNRQYALTKDGIRSKGFHYAWMFQSADLLQYSGKTMKVEEFCVSGHPLDTFARADSRAVGETRVCVFIVSDEVIGGYSMPLLAPRDTDARYGITLWALEGLHSDSALAAADLLQKKGYNIISYHGSQQYELTREYLYSVGGAAKWIVQPVNPDEYLGKIVNEEMFCVTGHPLDDYQNSNYQTMNKTWLTVITIEGKPVCGYSHPVYSLEVASKMTGIAFWTLEGENPYLEPGSKWQEDMRNWQAKYGP